MKTDYTMTTKKASAAADKTAQRTYNNEERAAIQRQNETARRLNAAIKAQQAQPSPLPTIAQRWAECEKAERKLKEAQQPHSSLPWHISRLDDEEHMIRDSEQADIAVLVGATAANAALIVRAVNSVEALIYALSNIEANLTGRDNFAERVESSLRYAREALAQWEQSQ